MKKYLALALLTCTGASQLSLHAMDKQVGPTPAESLAANLKQKSSNKATLKSNPQFAAAISTHASEIADAHGVSAAVVASAATAFAVVIHEEKTTPEEKTQNDAPMNEFLVASKDGEAITVEQDNLSRTQVISKDAIKKLHEADELDAEELELKRRKEAAIEDLKQSFRDIKEKRDVHYGLVTTKGSKLEEYKAKKETLAKEAEEKKAQAAHDAAASEAKRLAAATSAELSEAALKDLAESSEYTLARQGSFEKDLHKLNDFDDQLNKVTNKLEGYCVKAADLIQPTQETKTVMLLQENDTEPNGDTNTVVVTKGSSFSSLFKMFGL